MAQQRRIRVRSIRRKEPDLRRLAQALLGLARERREQETAEAKTEQPGKPEADHD